jgi:large subunit ribosomal protein L22
MADAAKAPAAPAKKMQFTARLRFARISARKMRYVVDLIRGKDYNSAMGILRTCSRRGAPFCMKLLESAFGNAENVASNTNLDIDGNKLHLVEARVDGGPIIKRWRPSSVRRPQMIKKRTCHVTFVLEERELKESKRDRAKRQRKDRGEQAKKTTPVAKPVAKPEEKKEGGTSPAPGPSKAEGRAEGPEKK